MKPVAFRQSFSRRRVLAGTGPRNGESRKDPRVSEIAGNLVPVCEDFLFLFFSSSKAGQAAEGHFGSGVISARTPILLRRFKQ